MPRHETFAREADDHYTAVAHTCHACAARDRKAHIRASTREDGEAPDPGVFYVVTRDED